MWTKLIGFSIRWSQGNWIILCFTKMRVASCRLVGLWEDWRVFGFPFRSLVSLRPLSSHRLKVPIWPLVICQCCIIMRDVCVPKIGLPFWILNVDVWNLVDISGIGCIVRKGGEIDLCVVLMCRRHGLIGNRTAQVVGCRVFIDILSSILLRFTCSSWCGLTSEMTFSTLLCPWPIYISNWSWCLLPLASPVQPVFWNWE